MGQSLEPDPAGDLTERVARWAAAGERYEVEFKSEQPRPLNDRDLVEAVVCLANGHGGVANMTQPPISCGNDGRPRRSWHG